MTEVRVPRANSIDDEYFVVGVECVNGATVTPGQVILVLESSKSTIEIEAPCAGVVTVGCRPGEDVPVGSVVATIANQPDIPSSASAVGKPRSGGERAQ